MGFWQDIPEKGHLNRCPYLAPFVTAPLSFLSSLTVLVLILVRKRSSIRHLPREQLLLGLSIVDMCSSVAYSFSTTPGERTTYHHNDLPTYGTAATCNAQGFLVQIGFVGAPLCNAALCFYYVSSVWGGVPDARLLQWRIPILQACILLFCVGSASFGLVEGLYHYAGALGCWIHHPVGTTDPAPTKYDLYQKVLGGVPIVGCFCFVVVSMIILYCVVRRQESRSSKYRANVVVSHARRESMAVDNTNGSGATNDDTDTSSSSVGFLYRSSINAQRVQTRRSSPQTQEPNRLPLTARTRDMGLLYSLSFIIVYLPVMLLVDRSWYSQTTYEHLRCVGAILTPLQGVFNLMIYTVPEWRSVFSNLWEYLFGSPSVSKGDTTHTTTARTKTSHRRGSLFQKNNEECMTTNPILQFNTATPTTDPSEQ